MVTAYGREEVLKQAEDSGFEDVLIKPVTFSMLFDTAIVALGADRERGRDRCRLASFDIDRCAVRAILLVEDNEINQEVAIGLLEDASIRRRGRERRGGSADGAATTTTTSC